MNLYQIYSLNQLSQFFKQILTKNNEIIFLMRVIKRIGLFHFRSELILPKLWKSFIMWEHVFRDTFEV